MPCEIIGCTGAMHGRRWCNTHYQRWRLYGDPEAPRRTTQGMDRADRFMLYVDKRGPDECWPWTGAMGWFGYGAFAWARGRTGRNAHRCSYELFVGPIPAGLHIDHVCHNRDLACPGGTNCPHRRCVNPAHLEAVTPGVNTLRGRSIQAAHAAQTHCKRGHEFTPENTYRLPPTKRLPNGGRECRACRKITRAAKKAAS